MNAFPISKSFTAVVVLLVALTGWTASKPEISREACETEKLISLQTNDDCKKPIDGKIRGDADTSACLVMQEAKARTECKDKDSQSAIRSNCTTLLKDYEKLAEELDKQCEQAGQEKIQDCQKKANSCTKDLNLGGFEEASEDSSETERILKTVYGITNDLSGVGKSVADSSGCTFEENEKEQDRSEQKIEKISKLKADIASLKEDAAKADDDVAKKKQEVEEEILKIEKEMDKRTNERKTEAQKETVKMQQDSLESVKRKKAAIDAMTDKNTEIANLRITQQEEAIKFTQSNLMKACRDQALELKTKLIENATKSAASNQGTATTGNIKKDVETFAKQCVKLAAVERNKVLKATQDKITRANSSVSNYKDVIKQEDESYAIRQKDIEARNKIADEEQTAAEQKKTKELAQLSQKVADMQALAEKKKASFGEKAKVKEDEYNAIIMKLQNLKPKFRKISADIRTGGRKATQFVEQCCGTDTKFADSCSRLKKDYSTEPQKKGTRKKSSGKT